MSANPTKLEVRIAVVAEDRARGCEEGLHDAVRRPGRRPTLKNLWSDRGALAMVRRYARRGVGRDLALRIYTTRLLGGDPALALHGGGNTSVKTVLPDLLGEPVEVLCVKGSGWDMAAIEPAGMPAVRLGPLRRLAGRDALGDEEMVAVLRGNLLDATAPNPSIETLLHAFLPQKFVDHTHANAVLALTDQPDGAEICAAVFGARVVVVPYIMSGFALAKQTLGALGAKPDAEGAILIKHGVFTVGETAKDSYDRMIDLVSVAEAHIAKARRKVFAADALPRKIAAAADVAPILRGLTATPVDAGERRFTRFVLDFRSGARILDYVNGSDVRRYSQQGPATPDHVVRVKPKPLVVPAPEAGRLDDFRPAAQEAVAAYRVAYGAYLARNQDRRAGPAAAPDSLPRVVLVPGLGLFGLGQSAADAAIAADLAEANADVIADAEAIGRFEGIPESDLFDVECWPPERAKLESGETLPLAGHVAVVTGGASGIGAATARAFAARGAEVAVLDLDRKAAEAAGARLGGLAIACDVTNATAVKAAFDRVSEAYGGVDIVVSNAGAAWQGSIGDISEDAFRKSFELNFWAHQRVARNAVRVMRAQGLGRCLLFNASKQAVNPGPDFGPYGVPKAATLALMRQYAIDHGAEGIRAAAVNADRIRSGLLTDDMIAARAKARGLSQKDYMSGNLLGLEVTADDVARAFVDLALAARTTGAVITVDGGNIAAAPR